MSNIIKCENCGCEEIDIIHKYKGYYVCPKCGRDTERLYEIEHDKEIRAKAIDEFVKAEDYLMDKIKEETADVNIDFEWRKVVCLDDIRRMLHQGLCEIAEQMKAGGIE